MDKEEINFCPYCDAAQHKIMLCRSDTFFCKECNRFFSLSLIKLKCSKCRKTNITKSDFPAASGEPIFHCRDCKKMSPASEFFRENNLI